MGLIRDVVLPVVGISKHQYYYQSKGVRSGRKPTETTYRLVNGDNIIETNEQVIEKIKAVKTNPDTNCGYQRMRSALILMGYFINPKKVYRIMKENNLLNQRRKKQSKIYAKYRVLTPEKPLTLLEMDIKYFWVARDNHYAYALTIIDTFTRYVLDWRVGFTMKAYQVKEVWEKIIINYLQASDTLREGVHIEIRNDNGPQFSAKIIQEFFKENYLNQVFTHPYTPQENGHVESFHSILSTSIGTMQFWTLEDLENRLKIFYHNYNNERIHGSIAGLPPVIFWNLWNQNKVKRIVMKNKKVKFKLTIPAQQISGNESLREVPCLEYEALEEPHILQKVEKMGTVLPSPHQQPSVQRSPSVVPC